MTVTVIIVLAMIVNSDDDGGSSGDDDSDSTSDDVSNADSDYEISQSVSVHGSVPPRTQSGHVCMLN